MNKKIFSTIMAAVMVCSAICAAVPKAASAASKKVYMTTRAEYVALNDTWQPREKVGGYYIWVDFKYENGTRSSSLKCAKSLKKGKAKTLRKVNSKTKRLWYAVVTDGKTIYYGVYDDRTDKGTIYQTTVKGTTHKKVKTIKEYMGVAAFYGGKIYYNAGDETPAYLYADHVESNNISLYSYDIAKKKTRIEKRDYEVDSGYGRYMSGSPMKEGLENYKYELYDAKAGKSSSLGECCNMVISGKTLYYVTVTYKNYGEMYTLKKCDLSGKNKKTIKKVKNMELHYLGRKAAYFNDDNTGKIKKLTYRTKKFTAVK